MYFEAGKDNTVVELAMQYTDGYSENVYTFANNINTQEGVPIYLDLEQH